MHQGTARKVSRAEPSARALARSLSTSPVTVLVPEKPYHFSASIPTSGAANAATAPSKQRSNA